MRGRRILLVVAVVAVLAGCANAGHGDRDGRSLTYWTVDSTPAAIADMNQVASVFTRRTGIKVKVVGMKDPQMAEAMTSAAAAGTMPDVVLHTTDRTVGWVREGLLDQRAATAVIDSLGPQTFNPKILAFVKNGNEYGAVPSNGWGQMLFYRKDLFAAAGLPAPDTFQKIENAARVLNGKNGAYGIVMSSKAGDRATLQTFEDFALANGCQLVGGSGQVTLGSKNCADAISWYHNLLKSYSAGGEQTTDSTRATYLAGKAAMVSWSPYLLNQLAGLDPDIPPSCAQCKKDPMWLAKNTGMVPPVTGPDATAPAEFGQTSDLGITRDANTDAAKKFVTYLLSDGYLEFLKIQPEGRVPMRLGTPSEPTKFVDAWPDLSIGTAMRGKTLRQVYGTQVKTISASANQFQRWGFPQGKGMLESAVYGDVGFGQTLAQGLSGELSPQQAAQNMQATAEKLAARK